MGASDKPTERAPLLSMEQINAWAAISKHYDTKPKDLQEHECRTMKHSAFMGGITTAMEWYEAKLTSGELITKAEHERLTEEAVREARWNDACDQESADSRMD